MNDVSKKRNRIAAIICFCAILIMIVCSFFALSTSATEFIVYDGVQIFNGDDVELFDGMIAEYHFLETLTADYLAYPYFYLVARWDVTDDNLPLNWVITNDEGNIEYKLQVVNGADGVISTTGEFQIIEFYYNGVITSSLENFFLINYLGGSSDGEAITPREFGYFAVFDPSIARYDDFDSWLNTNILDVLNSSTNGVVNSDTVLQAFENGLWRGYQRGYNEGKVYSKDYWFKQGKDVGLSLGALEEYQRVITEEKPYWEKDAFESGKAAGYTEGVKDAEEFTPQKVPFAIMDAIGTFFQGMLNVELLGINLLGIFNAIVTIGVGIFVFKKIL